MLHAPRLFLVAVVSLLATGPARLDVAQTLPAHVEARIIDGSGNEPFVGTVLIEGGRIRAAGRTVDVPQGAVTIDGSGRTVMPGLIDVRMRVDGSARADAPA